MITVWLSKELIKWSSYFETLTYLYEKGLDTSKPFSRWESPQKPHLWSYRGTALPDRVVGVLHTVVGVIPITIPWEGIE